MSLRKYLKDNILLLDGGMGTLLQSRGLKPGELPERWCITHPDDIREIHEEYYRAGSNTVSTNTFGANLLHFTKEELSEIIPAAVKLAKDAKARTGGENRFVLLDVGPTGKLLKPFGELDFEDAVEIFAETVRIGAASGVDGILIETMNCSLETKAAVVAAKENADLPILVSNAYSSDGKLMTGATPEAMTALLEGLGVDAIGANCSYGPRELAPIMERILKVSSTPVILKPNAGLPTECCGNTVYNVTPDEFAQTVVSLVKKGVRCVGGCCGTTPAYIKALSDGLSGVEAVKISKKNLTVVSSYGDAVYFGKAPVLIGERINPTGKKRLREALLSGDMSYVLGEAIGEAERGVHILDVNVGVPGLDEVATLSRVCGEIQAITSLPLQIDTSNFDAMEKAARSYNGKPLLNSVSGKVSEMERVFKIAKKYGAAVICLTLDENGIPADSASRVKIAEKIIAEAEKYGIDKCDLIFDTLAMTVSADTGAALATLDSLDEIKHTLGCHTSLGVSNVSFGLPERALVNTAFFTCAMERGLSAAIMNPHSAEMMGAYYAFKALHGLDEMCADYISYASNLEKAEIKQPSTEKITLAEAIFRGMKEKAASLTEELLAHNDGLSVIQREIIPALDRVGAGFEAKKVYLPNLLMSAEAAKCAFDVIKSKSEKTEAIKPTFVLATVEGDIHDIGKNIVKLLLENYGYDVRDLGRDVKAEDVVCACEETGAPFVGLSALMTTTVPAMEQTIKLLRERCGGVKIVVGGAVLTKEYAEKIGADFYAADAMETVRFAERSI